MNQTNISIANIDTNAAQAEAYDQGAEFAEKDWQWVRGDIHGPSSMAAHRERTWAFLIHEVCPEWAGHDEVRGAFFVGYEDRATELAMQARPGMRRWLRLEPWPIRTDGSCSPCRGRSGRARLSERRVCCALRMLARRYGVDGPRRAATRPGDTEQRKRNLRRAQWPSPFSRRTC